MEKSKSYKDLIVWQKSHDLVLEVYSKSIICLRKFWYSIVNQTSNSEKFYISAAYGIYKITKQFPKEELFGLTSQMNSYSKTILNSNS
jgi:hypothetical protein